jgi:PII-like signaling protein
MGIRMLEVKIFIDTEDQYGDSTLHEAILRYLLHRGIKGATLFRGVMGFGAHHHLNEPRRFAASDATPMMIVFVDEEDRVRSVLPALKEMIAEGLIVANNVEKL